MTPWTVAHPAPPSMGFSRQKYWSGLPFFSPGDLPDPGIKPKFPALQADSYSLSQNLGNSNGKWWYALGYTLNQVLIKQALRQVRAVRNGEHLELNCRSSQKVSSNWWWQRTWKIILGYLCASWPCLQENIPCGKSLYQRNCIRILFISYQLISALIPNTS